MQQKNLEDIINRKNIVTEKIPDGKISFESFNFGYKNNKMVLKDLNLEIKAGEKIGIVGRTGAGKSSMISALFRMRNPAKGDIILDGKSAISGLGLNFTDNPIRGVFVDQSERKKSSKIAQIWNGFPTISMQLMKLISCI